MKWTLWILLQPSRIFSTCLIYTISWNIITPLFPPPPTHINGVKFESLRWYPEDSSKEVKGCVLNASVREAECTGIVCTWGTDAAWGGCLLCKQLEMMFKNSGGGRSWADVYRQRHVRPGYRLRRAGELHITATGHAHTLAISHHVCSQV